MAGAAHAAAQHGQGVIVAWWDSDGTAWLARCRAFQPDIIHCSSPGIMWLAALIYSRLLQKPLVYSYHTHVPEYMPR